LVLKSLSDHKNLQSLWKTT